jgi:hypothetical protein
LKELTLQESHFINGGVENSTAVTVVDGISLALLIGGGMTMFFATQEHFTKGVAMLAGGYLCIKLSERISS